MTICVFCEDKATSSVPWNVPPSHHHPSPSQSTCTLFLGRSIRVLWFPTDWSVSRVVPEGDLSCIDPLDYSPLSRGSEVCEMWCTRPSTSTVFSDDLTSACGPAAPNSHIHSCKTSSESTAAHRIGRAGSAERLWALSRIPVVFKWPLLIVHKA